mmetsp:Transcript_55033/g.134961  ORF Transcript_55033/g.134961 Transcript_55033/m.134961 type:complete len:213 (-) Transcript_55033:3331-3969(-)
MHTHEAVARARHHRVNVTLDGERRDGKVVANERVHVPQRWRSATAATNGEQRRQRAVRTAATATRAANVDAANNAGGYVDCSSPHRHRTVLTATDQCPAVLACSDGGDGSRVVRQLLLHFAVVDVVHAQVVIVRRGRENCAAERVVVVQVARRKRGHRQYVGGGGGHDRLRLASIDVESDRNALLSSDCRRGGGSRVGGNCHVRRRVGKAVQ